ncbi:MAG: PAS domain-containing protein [Cytophagaceae bacterium]
MSNNEKKLIYLENTLKKALYVIGMLTPDPKDDHLEHIDLYEENTIEEVFSNALGNLNFSNHASNKSNEANNTYLFIKMIIESLPFPVFLKDHEKKYMMLNKQEADLFGLKESDIIGKTDEDFVADPEELDMIHQSDSLVLNDKIGIELPQQNFSLPNGNSYVFKTHKLPIINPYSDKVNILGFSVNITDTVNLARLNKVITDFNHPFL